LKKGKKKSAINLNTGNFEAVTLKNGSSVFQKW